MTLVCWHFSNLLNHWKFVWPTSENFCIETTVNIFCITSSHALPMFSMALALLYNFHKLCKVHVFIIFLICCCNSLWIFFALSFKHRNETLITQLYQWYLWSMGGTELFKLRIYSFKFISTYVACYTSNNRSVL